MIIDLNAAISGKKGTAQFAILVPTDVRLTQEAIDVAIDSLRSLRDADELVRDLSESELEDLATENLMEQAKMPVLISVDDLLDVLRRKIAHLNMVKTDYRLVSVPDQISDHKLMEYIKDLAFDRFMEDGFVLESFDLKIKDYDKVIILGRGAADACLHSEDYDDVD